MAKKSPRRSPSRSGSAKASAGGRKPWFTLWYRGCTVQQVYAVISALLGLALLGLSIAVMAMKEPKLADFNKNLEKDDQITQACLNGLYAKRYQLVAVVLGTFVLSFLINNAILMFYCNRMPSGAANVLWSLALYFIFLPIVNYLVGLGVMAVALPEFVSELKETCSVKVPPSNIPSDRT